MWNGAFGPQAGASVVQVFSVGLGAIAIVLSVLALSKGTGPQLELKGSRAGLAFAVLGIVFFLEGTSVSSPFLHSVSIALFYCGSALYLAGPRALLFTLPAGLIFASSFAPLTYGFWGIMYLDGLAYAEVVASVGVLWVRRKSPLVLECFLCGFFRTLGRDYCSACGKLFASPRVPLPKGKFLGFGAFVAAMMIALSLTIPLATATPNMSLVNYGLGGPSEASGFAPLPGWGLTQLPPAASAPGVEGYTLTQGLNRIQTYISASPFPGSALSSVNSTMTHPIPFSRVPRSLSPTMAGYTFTYGGAKYVGVQGVFAMGVLNGTVSPQYVAVNLSESVNSIARDNGTALFAAASSVVAWASGWSTWSSTVGSLQSLHQLFTQALYASSISVFVISLFTIARDDELAKVRRVESLRGLGSQEALILQTLATASKSLLGDQLYEETRRTDATITAPAFYSSVDELARRDLISPSLVYRKGIGTVFWRRRV